MRPLTLNQVTYSLKQIELEGKINKHKGIFDIACVTTNNPSLVISELIKVLDKTGIKYKRVNMYAVNCQKQNVKFEIEILQLENSDSLYLIKFKCIAGEQRDYKEVTSSILHNIQL